MSEIARRLTVSELSQRILEMAKTGVYRESLFETFHPMATKQQIRHAIRYAKQFGLHSVAQLRDAELGTYYQLDLVKFESVKAALQVSVPLTEADVFQRMTEAVVTIRMMLMVAGSGAIALFAIGVFCLFTHKSGSGWGLIAGSMSVGGIWAFQNALARKVITGSS
ncbi:hypothetical protein OsccyDRAFT_0539 [Leptolyngbyaceae cyanobacterium JSC-12]|nr:hypothetical protein OsccyDRAFT_0539 [Leptolyngbyaceae cyanobacterium JSC-12]